LIGYGGDVYHSGERVGTVQGGSGAADHLDAFHFNQVEVQSGPQGPAGQLDQGLAAVDEQQHQVAGIIGQRPRPHQWKGGLHLVDVEAGNPPEQVGD
jgi:hypothetical protein